ncbi:DUF4328 domain-containing protein [Actinomadura nitritigenes]|uniref:DUF4328 domain-containing protein n=1 Tax=Actinomadura nitritigenes TaxID=134602 RepID=A0ABS3R1T4_9ACTN|nr:DUF4328 domain-containing protein [Actinomadura nitritigenes]
MSVHPPPAEIIKPPRAAALVAVGALTGNALLLSALAAAGLWAIELVDRDGFTRRTDDVLDALAYGATGQLALTVLTGVAVIVWLWRARGVADVIEAPYGWGRPWAVIGWFVPVMSLWIPRSIVAALWRASGPRRAAWPVNAWWAAWVVYLLGGRAVDLDLSGSRAHPARARLLRRRSRCRDRGGRPRGAGRLADHQVPGGAGGPAGGGRRRARPEGAGVAGTGTGEDRAGRLGSHRRSSGGVGSGGVRSGVAGRAARRGRGPCVGRGWRGPGSAGCWTRG